MRLRTTAYLENVARYQREYWPIRTYNEAVRELQRRYRMRKLGLTKFPTL